ncbi:MULTISPECIES: large conductance mechanosensitive channel protein MscL [Streptomyces]|uniref:large conductance mechanosensitive channel protein MscL n=1 Tax=Streptomyces TaxID=1883 RepID=UPI000CD5BBAA|nr:MULTISPECIES: large conductance mechanosensitive channel protein MscL [Streptomyces]
MSEEKQGVIAGFREFLMRGNVVELAVAVVVGAAFTKIVNAVVDGVIGPLVGAFGTQNLDNYTSCLKGPCQTVNGEMVGVQIAWGTVLSATLTFLITAGVVYFLMILPINRLKARMDARKPQDDTPAEKTELEILAEIRDELIAQRAGGSSGPVEMDKVVTTQRSGPDQS